MRIAIPLILFAASALLLLLAFPWKHAASAANPAAPTTIPANAQQATFAAGCFWGVEETFRRLPGVLVTSVGYTGGFTKNPTYEQVCTDLTGHAEAVLVTFDPTKISYAELLDAFWTLHDPTTKNRQGPDHGSQYRSAIYFHSSEQEKIARASLKEVEAGKFFKDKIVTEVVSAATFYPAEDYHQQYFAKSGGECHTGIAKVQTQLAKTAADARKAPSSTQPKG